MAVISGGDWPQFEKQVLSNLPHNETKRVIEAIVACLDGWNWKPREAKAEPTPMTKQT